jgi:competence ComEA-like helix-hairpin-helix protein
MPTDNARKFLIAFVVLIASVSLARREEREPRPAGKAPVSVTADATARTGQGDALRDGRRLDVNLASPAEFEMLPGVGPSLARRLVEDRERRGFFRSSADLKRVKGVGEKTLAKFERFLRFGSEQVEVTAYTQLDLGRAGDGAALEQHAGADVQAQGPSARPQVVHADQHVNAGANREAAILVEPKAAPDSKERDKL